MKKPNQSSKKAPAAPKRPARDARDDNPCESLSLQTVEQYVKYKAFDVIGNGNYRRYVNNCKEKNEPWALEITNAVAQMSALTKSIQSLVNDLQKNNKTGASQPPTPRCDGTHRTLTPALTHPHLNRSVPHTALPNTGLHTLCQTVIENNTPPIDQHTVIAECSVSGKQKCQCIVLKCKGAPLPAPPC